MEVVLCKRCALIFLQDKSSIDAFPIPLAVIGGKYDIYQVRMTVTPEMFEKNCSNIICLKNNSLANLLRMA